MKILYLDCFAGISGDMMLGALVDAGLSIDDLRTELAKLDVSGFAVEATPAVKKGITGTKVDVETAEGHVHRGLNDITRIIEQSTVADRVKRLSLAAFTRLAEVEAGIHNKSVDEIHFHEVGALDAIVDIVGSMIGISLLGIDRVSASKVQVGTGFVNCAHGEIPLPAPATLALLKNVPIFSRGIEAELTTPTGAAILTTLAKEFGPPPSMTVESIGYGAGSRDLEIPNLLRAVVGRADADAYDTDSVQLIETNLDNMNPEHFEYVTERLLAEGALDVFLTPIIMKKSRPATMLSVLCDSENEKKMIEIIFSETTTLGVRLQPVDRRKLSRESLAVETKYGAVRIKIARQGEVIKNIAPEYEDCKKLAAKMNIPLKDIYDEARRAAQEYVS